MSQAPHDDPPTPQPTPDNPYELQPVQPPAPERDLTSEIVTISVIVASLVLLGVGAMFWVRDNRPAMTPPTPTATRIALAIPPPSATLTETPVVSLTLTPPTSAGTAAPTAGLALPLITGNSNTPSAASSPSPIHLPAVSSDDRQPVTPTSLPTWTPSPPPAPTVASQALGFLALPYLSVQIPPTATPAPPTSTPLPVPSPLPGATATTSIVGTPIGTPITTPTDVPTGVPLVIDDMSARMRETVEVFYIGPSSIYTPTEGLSVNTEISLHGRDRTGEWVLACCVDDDDADDVQDDRAWVRQAYVIIEGNELDGGDEDDEIDRNDARWLPVVGTRPDLRPLPTVTPPPDGDFPLYRYTPDNRAFLPRLPNLSTTEAGWPIQPQPQALLALQAPLIVSGSNVYAASADNHIYAWNRDNGSQQARRDLGNQVFADPAADDGLLYFVDQTGWLHALQDPINEDPIWQSNLNTPVASITGINVYSHTLFINMTDRISVVDGEDGTIVNQLLNVGNPLYPAIGGQLLYVASDTVRAYDILAIIEDVDVDPGPVWEIANLSLRASAPPVYTSDGVESLAELYVVADNNRIYSFDANTGIENWNEDNEESASGLAVSDDVLYISGDNYVKARTRLAPEQDVNPILWRTDTGTSVLSGPFVSSGYVIVFLSNGNIRFLDAATGESLRDLTTYPVLPSASGAISGEYVFMPGQNGILYRHRQSP